MTGHCFALYVEFRMPSWKVGGNRPLREVPQQHVTQYETATAPTISGGQAVLLANPLMSRPILVRCRERAALVLATGNEVGRRVHSG